MRNTISTAGVDEIGKVKVSKTRMVVEIMMYHKTASKIREMTGSGRKRPVHIAFTKAA